MEDKKNNRGRKKTKDRVSTSIFLDRDLHEWTVGKNRSDIVNEAVRFRKNHPHVLWGHIENPVLPDANIRAWADQIIKAEDEAILRGDYLNPEK